MNLNSRFEILTKIKLSNGSWATFEILFAYPTSSLWEIVLLATSHTPNGEA
jgi:hypothetical protein